MNSKIDRHSHEHLSLNSDSYYPNYYYYTTLESENQDTKKEQINPDI